MSVNNDWLCPLCGETRIGHRNFYKNQAPDTIGYADEEYCEGCGVALANIPHVLEDREQLKKIISVWQTDKIFGKEKS